MSFRIDKTVPVPAVNRYPLQEMKVGESFEFPVEFRASVQTLASVAKKHGREFRVKKVSPETCRVWRIK